MVTQAPYKLELIPVPRYDEVYRDAVKHMESRILEGGRMAIKPCIVIPSNKEIFFEYLPSQAEADIVVVFDGENLPDPLKEKYNRPGVIVYTDKEQDEILGDKAWVIKRRTAGVRNFGLYMAWKLGYKVVITTDDDCVLPPDFITQHLKNLYEPLRSFRYALGTWYNTLQSEEWFPRGFPYEMRPLYKGTETKELQFASFHNKVVCSMGLWRSVVDFNGLDKFGVSGLPHEVSSTEPTLILSHFPLCSMNSAVRREATIGLYNVAMGHDICPGYKLFRLEDIWGGYIFQKVAMSLGDWMVVGDPVVEHIKEGNLVWEIRGEHYGHLMSSHFYRWVDAAASVLSRGLFLAAESNSYPMMYAHLTERLLSSLDSVPSFCQPTFQAMALNLVAWTNLFLE